MNYEQIKSRFKQIRIEQKLSREKFAEKMGLSRGVIDNIELNRVEQVKDLYIQLLCDTFNVNEDWVKNGIGEIYDIKSNEINVSEEVDNMVENESYLVKKIAKELPRLAEDDLKTLLKFVKNLNK